MLTKNITLKKFGVKNNFSSNRKKIKVILKNLSSSQFFNSLTNQYKYSFDKNKIQKYKKFSNFSIIGIGGSALGIKAIYNFLKFKIKKNFTFFDNLVLSKKNYQPKKNLNIVISKSGNTLETISNFYTLQNKKNSIFICEKSNSYLRNLANKLKCEIIDHRNYIGGRYSVLSEVGMLPSILMGLNEKKFKNYNNLVKNKVFINGLVDSVFSTIFYIKKKKLNSIILNYDESSDDLFRWYQQLVAESLGKKSKGLLPFISSMPRDNHSLMQFYLDGPKNSFYTFYDVVEKNKKKINFSQVLKSYDYLKNKSLSEIKTAQKNATMTVFEKKQIPFRNFNILNRSEKSLGEIFTFFMLETILLGKFLNVNPFDQPSVELIKKETRKVLSN